MEEEKSWWQRNFRKPNGGFDTTRALKFVALYIFVVYALFFTGLMIVDFIRYVFNVPVDFNASIMVAVKVGAVAVGSVLVPIVDYRIHKHQMNGKANTSQENASESEQKSFTGEPGAGEPGAGA